MTSLKEYLFYKKKSITKFANEVGITRAYMNSIVLGISKPSKFLAMEIQRHTDMQLSLESLMNPNSEQKPIKNKEVMIEESVKFEKLLSEFKENVRQLGS